MQLRCHESRCAHLFCQQLASLQPCCNSEVAKFHPDVLASALATQHVIVWLHISVADVLLMQVHYCLQHLPHEELYLRLCKASVSFLGAILKVSALTEFHDKVILGTSINEVVELDKSILANALTHHSSFIVDNLWLDLELPHAILFHRLDCNHIASVCLHAGFEDNPERALAEWLRLCIDLAHFLQLSAAKHRHQLTPSSLVPWGHLWRSLHASLEGLSLAFTTKGCCWWCGRWMASGCSIDMDVC
mmetsp:Transcript_75951/g.180601  ORF Transcript_75951/g.180601 Transcript_75951/m.180601 type:complete len:247 (+) Transcript_75951:1690-2430(+)